MTCEPAARRFKMRQLTGPGAKRSGGGLDHLTQRVAWHDQRWNGTICRAPSANSFCVMLDEVRKHRNDDVEDAMAGKPWAELDDHTLPPCIAQAAGFMSAAEWHRVVRHPYQSIEKAAATHSHLRPTPVKVDPHSFFAVPFWWMLRENGEHVDRAFGGTLPADEDPPMSSAWVFGRERQRAISDSFFGPTHARTVARVLLYQRGPPAGRDGPAARRGGRQRQLRWPAPRI